MSLDTVHSAVILHSSTEVFNINSLPLELLPKIFKRLNAHDRKNVRLTCRLWNEVCNLREIIEYEKFVFHPGKDGCGFPDLGAHIQECKALRPCLEFKGIPLCQLPSNLWANIGERVQSLFIQECEKHGATISNIIIHCTNLKTLHLHPPVVHACTFKNSHEHDTDEHPKPPAELSFGSFTFGGMDKLIKRNIERRNLTSLILYSHETLWLSTRKLWKLLQIFPCLQTFSKVKLYFFYPGGLINFHSLTVTEWVLQPTIENLVSTGEDDVDILDFSKISNSKLKEFNTSWDLDSATEYDLFLNFCYEQKELEKLALDVLDSNNDGTDNILFLILRSFPKLKELEFQVRSSPEFLYSPEKMSEFFVLTSKLESMRLVYLPNECPLPVAPLPVIPLSPLAEYSTLKSLTLTQMINPNFTYEILRRCRTTLHHLSVMYVNNEIIQIILEAHTGLKSLCIDLLYLGKPNEDGSVPEGKKYPFRKLRNLEYLCIDGIGVDILKNNLSQFIFPKLKFFEFNCFRRPWPNPHHEQNFHTMLRVVCKGAPYLETLKISRSIFKSIHFVNLLGNDVQMKCLRYITICSSEDLHTGRLLIHGLDIHKHLGSIDAIFSVCPSLYFISFGWGNYCTYFYNRHSKEVEHYSYFKM